MKRLFVITLIVSLVLFIVAGCAKPAEEPAPSSATSSPAPAVVEDAKPKYTLPTDPYYVLIIGNDSRNDTVESNGEDDPGRSDTVMVARIDPQSYLITLFTLPRDTPVVYEGSKVKLNRPYKYGGIEGARTAIEDLLGIEISYYLDLSMAKFIDFYNSIGGVDAEVPININLVDVATGDKIYLDAGSQHLNGNEALVLARVRKMYVWGDACRQYNSRHMIESTITACAQDPALAAKNLDIFLGYVSTDWPTEALALQVADFCEHSDQIHFLEGTGPYDGGIDEETGGWMCYADPETWDALKKEFTEGRDPTTVLPLAPLDAN